MHFLELNTLSVGVDLSKVRDVIIIGEPEDVDDMFQKFGRAGRDREIVTDPRAILYLPAGAEERAKCIAEAEVTGEKGKLRKGDNMDISIARMVLAECKEDEQDRQYGNQRDEDSCIGCQPELIDVEPPKPKAIAQDAVSRIPRLKRLSKVMRVLGKQHLEQYRLSLWDAADEKTSGFTPLPSYLPLDDMHIILDSFALLISDEQLTEVQHLLGHNGHILNNLEGFFNTVHTMDIEFGPIRTANMEKARVGRAAAAAKKLQAKTADAARLTGIVLRVNTRYVHYAIHMLYVD
ncbi:hypothetical protein FIBSPDRAFT_962285 [Athelia psychrophila]|uniref:Helicase C-terminal domain-containing protein n=1 Tax=Athelia psychrophila TaxID=1759441 RepID=A0A166AAQ3_9AGAM|nr:hypothetical protein FIBSPDRAFT_962285 [Fibularhizoctonia sp. CBS 109695]